MSQPADSDYSRYISAADLDVEEDEAFAANARDAEAEAEALCEYFRNEDAPAAEAVGRSLLATADSQLQALATGMRGVKRAYESGAASAAAVQQQVRPLVGSGKLRAASSAGRSERSSRGVDGRHTNMPAPPAAPPPAAPPPAAPPADGVVHALGSPCVVT